MNEQSLDEQIRMIRDEIMILSNRINNIEIMEIEALEKQKHANSEPFVTICIAYRCTECGKSFHSPRKL